MSTSLPMVVPAKAATGSDPASLPVNTSDGDSSRAFANVLNAHLKPVGSPGGDADSASHKGEDGTLLMPFLSASTIDGKKLPLDLSKIDTVDGNALPLPPGLTWSGMLVVNNADGSGPKLYQLSADGHSLSAQIDPNMRAQVSRAMNQFSPMTTAEMPEMLTVAGKMPNTLADNPLTNMKAQSLLFSATATTPGLDGHAGQKFAEFLPASLLTNNADNSNAPNGLDLGSAGQGMTALGALSHQTTGQINTTPQLHLAGNPQSPAWAQGLGERMQWLVQQNIQGAEIRLNPPELGALEVKLKISHEHGTQIHFSSPNGAVRESIEAAIPRLREMFAESGLMLGDVNVSHQSLAEQNQNGDSGRESSNRSAGGPAPIEAATGGESRSTQRLVSDGLVDMYV